MKIIKFFLILFFLTFIQNQKVLSADPSELFGIKIGSKLTDYKVIKKIHTFKYGTEVILIDPPQKNDEFEYYAVEVSPISKTIFNIKGFTKKTFGKYKPVERLEYLSNLSKEQLNPMNMVLSDKKTFCTNIESDKLKLATEDADDDKSFQGYVEIITNYFRVTLPRAKGREVIKRCYLINANTYDVETPLKSVLNDLNTVYRNNINRNKCQSYLDTYKTYFLQKFNLDKNKLEKSERAVGRRTITKFPGYVSSSQGIHYGFSFTDSSDTWSYTFSCPDSVPDYNSDIRGAIYLSAQDFMKSKIFPEMREYNKTKKTQNDQQQKQQNQQKIDNLNKKGL